MQEYFQHSSFIADVARQFMEQTQHKKILDQAFDFLMSYRVDEIYRVGPEQIDIPVVAPAGLFAEISNGCFICI